MSEGGQFGVTPTATPDTQTSGSSTFLSETVQRLDSMTAMDSGAARELMNLGIRLVSFTPSVPFAPRFHLYHYSIPSVPVENLVSTWTVFCKANLITKTPDIIFLEK